MITVIGVRFRNAGKIYYFDPGEEKIHRGASVIVETARGLEMGTVMLPNKEVDENSVVQPLKPVIRLANEEDFQVVRENKVKQKEAYKICQEKIRKHNLEMKLVDVEYTFDNNKILFYFTANGRIDFRELVKDLASIFKTRIELRQIGVRDETKLLGGVGICGRGLCCHTYLADFVPVSIKMAKEQNLSLNPTKISGVCGRLMCCLKNEEDTYEYLNSKLPNIGETVLIPDENVKGIVQEVSALRQKVKVALNNENGDIEVREFSVEELKGLGKKKCCHMQDEEACEAVNPEGEGKAAETKAPARREDKAQREDRPRRERRPQREDRQDKASRENGSEAEGGKENNGRGDRPNRRDRGERRNRQERGENREQDRSRQERGENRRQDRNRQDRSENREQDRNRQDRGENREQDNNRGGNRGRRDRRRSDRGENGNRNRSMNRENGSAEANGEQNSQNGRPERSERRNRGRRDPRRENRQGDSGNGSSAGERKNPEA